MYVLTVTGKRIASESVRYDPVQYGYFNERIPLQFKLWAKLMMKL
jgi:hypothetical protein